MLKLSGLRVHTSTATWQNMNEKYSFWVEISWFFDFGSVTFFVFFFFNNVSGRLPESRFSIHENWPISAPRWSWKLIFGYVGGIYVCFEFFWWKKIEHFFDEKNPVWKCWNSILVKIWHDQSLILCHFSGFFSSFQEGVVPKVCCVFRHLCTYTEL